MDSTWESSFSKRYCHAPIIIAPPINCSVTKDSEATKHRHTHYAGNRQLGLGGGTRVDDERRLTKIIKYKAQTGAMVRAKHKLHINTVDVIMPLGSLFVKREKYK